MKHTLGLQQVRAVDHLSFETDHPRPRSSGEGGNNLACPGYLSLGGHESGVDGFDLVGVYRELAGKAISARAVELSRESLLVAEINMHAVDRLDTERSRG